MATLPDNTAQAEMLRNRLRKTARKLRKWRKREGIEAWRCYDRDIPEVPLVIEQYGPWAQVAVRLREGERRADGWLEAIVAATAEGLGIAPDHVVVKQRRRQRGKDQYERREDAQKARRFAVSEGSLRFWVDLWTYLDTGLFLDHRPLRQRIGAAAQGKRVLNLFAYTGSFTVYAAAGGARSSTTVDLSRTYLQWAEDNLALNGLQHPRHELVHADVEQFLRERAGRRDYDIVVLDPPSFSNSKRADTFDVQRDHARLCLLAEQVLKPGGTLWFSTNLRRFKLDLRALADLLPEDVTAATIPPDVRDPKAHQAWKMRACG